jgi:hypothetical protein
VKNYNFWENRTFFGIFQQEKCHIFIESKLSVEGEFTVNAIDFAFGCGICFAFLCLRRNWLHFAPIQRRIGPIALYGILLYCTNGLEFE